jgi:hypothetical protein
LNNSVESAGDKQHVEGEASAAGRVRPAPREHRDAGQQELDENARRPDQCPLPLAAKRPGRRRINVRDRCQDEEHDSHLVNFTVTGLHRVAVSQLMQQLDQRVEQPDEEQIARSEQLVTEILGQFVPVSGHQTQGRA